MGNLRGVISHPTTGYAGTIQPTSGVGTSNPDRVYQA